MSKQYFDLLILAPLQEEAVQLFEVFPLISNRSTDTTLRAVVATGDKNYTAILVQSEGMGRGQAANAVDNALNAFEIGLVVCVGIAGAISSDLRLGDVCYSEHIYDVLNNSKATSRGKNAIEVNFSPDHYSTPREVVAALQFLQTLPDRRHLYDNWRHAQREAAELTPSNFVGASVKNNSSEILLPQAVAGAIACGSVSASEYYNAKLKGLNRKILAIETESGGIFEKCKQKGVPALTIRGISDLADASKAELEAATSGSIRQIAARNAAEFLKLQFKNDQFCSWLAKRRGDVECASSMSTGNPKDLNTISSVIDEVTNDVSSRLTELSADLKGRAPGYSLPLPRIVEVEQLKIFKIDEKSEPKEIDNVVEKKNMIAIVVPKNYPDPSLAWVIASNLLGKSATGLPYVPIVSDFSSIKAPRGDFASGYMGATFRKAKLLNGLKVVHIVDSIHLGSRTKTEHLQNLIGAEPESKFVLIFRNEVSALKESELMARLGASLYKLCEVSFAEIARFIQQKFDMTEVQAEATALKMRKTFAKFQLDAHPTYFAGISRDILWKILEANRRAELIGLAVSGFLSFIVADDEDEITLSRSTRERFLRSLATEINIEKRTFDLSVLTDFVKNFATRHDFSIDSRKFINAFIDNGILSDFDEKINFSLPFIEYYLLASELKDNELLAIKYFNTDDPDFDFSTFDLYAEIGPSARLVENIKVKIRERAAKLSVEQSETNVLLTGQVHPEIMLKKDKLPQIYKQVIRLRAEIAEGKSERAEKQKLLDIADRAQREATEQSFRVKFIPGVTDDGPDAQSEKDEMLFSIGVYLVGSGAEYLEASDKRDIAGSLIILGGALIDRMTKAYLEVEFGPIKQNILSDEAIENYSRASEIGNSDLNPDRIKKFLSGFLDLVEFLILSIPFRQIVTFMCEHAQNKVLATTLENSKINTNFERLLRAIWLSDVEPKKGYEYTKLALKVLPEASFLRLNMASHLLIRAYWNHWKPADRLSILESAAETLKSPTTALAGKGEIIRMIKAANVSTTSD